MWAYESDVDYSDFFVGADGTYSLNHSCQESYNEIVGWTSHDALETKSGWNTLRLERRPPALTMMNKKIRFMHNYVYHFYLNGNWSEARTNGPPSSEPTWDCARVRTSKSKSTT